MKYRTTAKAVRNGYGRVYSVSYCGMQELLRYSEPVAYICGVYGWNADVYNVPGRNEAICTGYRPTGRPVDWATVEKYERAARAVNSDYSIPYEERKTRVSEMLRDCLGELRTR